VWGSDLGRASASPLQGTVTFLALGTVAPADPMPTTGAPYIGLFLDQWVKYAVTRDATFHSLTLDPENPGPWANRISELSTQLDTSTDISAFAARDGKLLLAHGLSDVLVSTRATEVYCQRLQAQMGPTFVDTFARYYESRASVMRSPPSSMRPGIRSPPSRTGPKREPRRAIR
jgi:feruloyl esterase